MTSRIFSFNPTFLETIGIPRELARRVQALVSAIGWWGLFQLEMLERPDGTLHAIDFNPRPYGSIGLARPAGAPLVTQWCASLLHDARPPASAPAGFAYRWEEGDAHHILWRLRNGDRRGALVAAQPVKRTTYAYFEPRDPLPFVGHCVDLARVRVRHMLGCS